MRRGHGIQTVAAERMTSHQTTDRQAPATDGAEPLYGFCGIRRTGRHETAGPGIDGGKQELVPANQGEHGTLRRACFLG
jgi:hypothetical protein